MKKPVLFCFMFILLGSVTAFAIIKTSGDTNSSIKTSIFSTPDN